MKNRQNIKIGLPKYKSRFCFAEKKAPAGLAPIGTELVKWSKNDQKSIKNNYLSNIDQYFIKYLYYLYYFIYYLLFYILFYVFLYILYYFLLYFI